MIFKKVLSQKIAINITAIALLFSIIKYPITTAYSQESNNNSTNKATVTFNPPPVEDNGAPAGNREGAGSHGLCKITDGEKDKTPLVAIIPETTIKTTTKTKVYAWGETVSANPTFWFYVAYPVNSQVEFILQDAAENEVYQTTFPLDKTQGIISFSLPQNKVNLETNKSYHWYLYVTCDPESSPDDFVEGWVKRVALTPNIKHQLEVTPPLERISIYAENGLWFDTLSSIGNLQKTAINNNEIANIFTDLLQQIGLEEISQTPIVKEYNLEN